MPPPFVVKDAGFKTPESILYDPEQDVYLVSNIDGNPAELDKNGFISKLSPDGKVSELKWIDGSKPATELNAPKGMAIVGDKLYVADVTTLRIFDRKTGKALGKLRVPGATFLNGLAASPDGVTLYMTDTGMKPGKDGFDRTLTDAVWTYNTKTVAVKPLLKGKELFQPNGIVADKDGVWVVTYGANELYQVSAKGAKGPSTNLPKGGLDGLVKLDDGSILVSSWEASKVFRGVPGGRFEPLVENTTSPAGLGYDSKRQRVLIPIFTGDAVHIQSLPELAPLAAATPEPAASADPSAAPAPAAPAAKPATTPTPAAKPATKPAAPAAMTPAPAKPPATKPSSNLPAASAAPPAAPKPQ